MVPYFTRLRFAFRTFFAILDYGRIPDDVAAALGAAAPPPEPQPQPGSHAEHGMTGAAQMLAVLQRDGRLIDFLMEDIAPFPDAQIGAAARDVHAGARQALLRYVTLAPVLDGDEGTSVEIAAGTDAAMVKLIGNLSGAPPFRGVVRHRGWSASRIELPATGGRVIAPAEVEVP